tara:strand:- start:1497 stop:1997 length:501 start_codon:yes stop_codon:yes gene_type:complete
MKKSLKNKSKIFLIIISSVLFISCASMNDNHHRSMSMADKSCCCKSDSKSDSNSCSMNKKMNKNHTSMSNTNNLISMKMNDESKEMSCCNKNSKKDKSCSMCMKGKKHNHEKMFDKLDKNSDEKISISEFLNRHNDRFDSLDLDSDGFLSKDELTKKQSNDSHKHH